MTIETWHGTDEHGKSVRSPAMTEVTSSEGNRRDAHGDVSWTIKFGSFLEEYESLLIRKRETEEKLSAFSKAAMLKRQQQIRSEGGGLDRWIDEKHNLHMARQELVKAFNAIEKRLGFIKGRAMEQKRALGVQNDPESKEWQKAIVSLLAVAEEIRDLLAEKIKG